MKKLSLQSKLVLSFASLLILLLLCQLGFNMFFASEYYTYKSSQAMNEAYEQIQLNYDGEVEDIQELLRSYEDGYNLDIKLVASDETVLYETSNRFGSNIFDSNFMGPPPRDMPQLENGGLDTSSPEVGLHVSEHSRNDTMVLRLFESFVYEGESISVVMFLTVSSIENSVSVLGDVGIMITCAVLVLGLFLFILLSKSITKPIGEIQKTAQSISQLNFSAKVKEQQPSAELSSLAQSINAMSAKLSGTIQELNIANEQLQTDIDAQKKLEQMRREFVANVSHEMKTPLALLQIYAENLKNNVEGIDKGEYCDVIMEESQTLSDMVSSMLDMSSLESGMSQPEKAPLCLSDLCREYVDKIAPLLEGYDFSCSIEENIWVVASAKHIEQAVKNYINNAMEHTPKSGHIEVKLAVQGDRAQFSVFNEGSSIAQQELPHIWESFYRSDKARVRKNKNVGMGLYIVSTIIKQHDGKHEAHNCEDGVVFSFSLAVQK